MKTRFRTSGWAKSFERSFVAMTRIATASGARVLANGWAVRNIQGTAQAAVICGANGVN